jgi:biopolymer transport protein ExbD
VMFFLLASFMMVSLSMEKSQTLPMSLPAAVYARDAFRPDALQIGIEQDARVSLGTERVDFAALDAELQRRYRANPETPIFVSADRMATHSAINRVLQRIRRAGFQQISFVTDHQGGTAPPPDSVSPATEPPNP